MNKRVRTLILSSVALVVAVGMLIALLVITEPPIDNGQGTSSSNPSSSSPSVDTSIDLIDKSTDENGKRIENPISRIDITLPTESFTVELDEEDGLRVSSYADFVPNSTKLNSLATYLKSISASRLVKQDAGDLSVYGFSEDKKTAVTVTYYDGTVYSFELGMESPGDAGRYFRQADSGDVYLVSSYLGTAVDTPSLTYISHTLITAPTVNTDDRSGSVVMRNMELTGTLRPQKVYFRRAIESDSKALQHTGYVITSPALRGMEDSTVQAITQLTSLTAAAVVCPHPTQEQLKQYGLDTPFSVSTFELAVLSSKTTQQSDGTELKEEYYYNVQTHTVRLGGKDENGYYYALVDDLDLVVTLMPTAVPWAEATYDTLVDPLLFMQMITDIAHINITTENGTHDFKLTHFPDITNSDESLLVTSDGQTYSTPHMRKLYQVLMNIKRVGPTTREVPDTEPTLTVELIPVEGSQGVHMKAQLYRVSGSVYLCRQQNGDIYEVTARSVNHAIEQLTNYLNGAAVVL